MLLHFWNASEYNDAASSLMQYWRHCFYSVLKNILARKVLQWTWNWEIYIYVLNVFIDIQTSKELIQMDTDKMMTYGTFTMDDKKLTQS